jgi:hypothetical protein
MSDDKYKHGSTTAGGWMEENEPTDTPRTDACPYCGSESYVSKDAFHDSDGNPQWRRITRYECGSTAGNKATICFEREHRKKAEAEVERLQNGFQGSCYCCEPVGILNQKLEVEVERLRHLLTEASYRIADPAFVAEIEATLNPSNEDSSAHQL